MFAVMFLAIALELIASMGSFGALVAQNMYTNSAAGWYVRLDWTAVYSYAVTVLSIIASFSFTVGAIVRNASGNKRTCAAWFNQFAIFLLSFVMSVLWVVIAGFAYRNPLPMRYPCNIFQHLRGSLEMLGLASGKSLVEEGGLLVGICQSSKAFLVLAGIGLGLWILILVLSCVAMVTGLEPPKKKASSHVYNYSSHKHGHAHSHGPANSSQNSASHHHHADLAVCNEEQCLPANAQAQQPAYPPAAAAPHNGRQDLPVSRNPRGQPRPINWRATNICNVPNCRLPNCRQKSPPLTRAHTHHRHRHSDTSNIAKTPSLPLVLPPRQIAEVDRSIIYTGKKVVIANSASVDAFAADGYNQDILPRGIPTNTNIGQTKSQRLHQHGSQQIDDEDDSVNGENEAEVQNNQFVHSHSHSHTDALGHGETGRASSHYDDDDGEYTGEYADHHQNRQHVHHHHHPSQHSEARFRHTHKTHADNGCVSCLCVITRLSI
ncbi:hypothetical protein BX661DRAFT_180383, partial [Kickxella alabastrina]|uniref:uncharacterized protein n=1 Tax=Kickxella alabastrina TaxID=61397 RepID=UPI002220F149